MEPVGCGARKSGCDKQESLWIADLKLVKRARQGDEAAWLTLRKNSYSNAFSAVRKRDYPYRLLTQQDCEDIIEEAYYRCYRDMDSFYGASTFSTWLCGYVVNITKNLRSRRMTQIRKQHLLNDIALTRHKNLDPLVILIEWEWRSCLQEAFDTLPRIYRLILFRHIIYGDCYAKIAKQLGITRKEVSLGYDAALQVLRRQYLKRYAPQYDHDIGNAYAY